MYLKIIKLSTLPTEAKAALSGFRMLPLFLKVVFLIVTMLMLVVVPSMLAVVAMFIEIHSGSVIPLLRIIGLMMPM